MTIGAVGAVGWPEGMLTETSEARSDEEAARERIGQSRKRSRGSSRREKTRPVADFDLRVCMLPVFLVLTENEIDDERLSLRPARSPRRLSASGLPGLRVADDVCAAACWIVAALPRTDCVSRRACPVGLFPMPVDKALSFIVTVELFEGLGLDKQVRSISLPRDVRKIPDGL